jgi:hypothetical protein
MATEPRRSSTESTENVTANAVKLVGEIFVPGASQLMAGRVGSGLAHLLLGGLAVAVLTPVAPVLAGLVGLGVRMDSYSESVHGRSLLGDFRHDFRETH